MNDFLISINKDNTIKSISYNQHDIIFNILKLNNIDRIDCDPFYNRGNFYSDNRIKQPRYISDIAPVFDYVLKKDASNLDYLKDKSIKSIILDPPFLATKGKKLGKMVYRFGGFKSENELKSFYTKFLMEAYRCLMISGICIFKCQDKVSSGIQYWNHVYVINEALKLGFYCKDLFILLSKNRIVADWKKVNQKHARKYHSYFLVFEKKGVK